MTTHLQPTRRRACLRTRPRLAPLAASVLLALAAAPAQSADRFWTFLGGCRTADWFGTVTGPNFQGQNTCWASSLDGFSGQSLPTAVDQVFISAPNATSTLLVNFADVSRVGSGGVASSLLISGSTSFAAGLSVDRLALGLNTLVVGALSGRLGTLVQTGGAVGVTGNSVLTNGEYLLSGGQFSTGALAVTGDVGVSRFAQTGGVFNATTVTMNGSASSGAVYSQTAGVANIGGFAMGSALAGGRSTTATVSGGDTFFKNSGLTVIGGYAAAQLTVQAGGRANSQSLGVGVFSGGDGLLTIDGAGSRWITAASTTVGLAGSGRLVVRGGAAYSTATMELNSAPALFGGALGAALEVGGAGSQVTVSGLLTTGAQARSSMTVRDGGTVQVLEARLGSNRDYRGNAELFNGGIFNVQQGLAIGDKGVAVLNATGGSQISSRMAVVSNEVDARGVVQLAGAGTRWINSDQLTIGSRAPALVQVSDGARLESGSTGLGQSSGVVGELYFSGHDSRWVASQGFSAGVNGTGLVSVTAGAGVQSLGTAVAGLNANSFGVMVFSGTGTRWDHVGDAALAQAGAGQLNVDGGAVVQLNGTVTLGVQAGSAATVTVGGAGSALNSTRALGVGSRGAGVVTFESGATGQVASLLVGEFTGSSGDLVVQGSGTRLQTAGTFMLGQEGATTLAVRSGAALLSGPASLAGAQWARGAATVDGAGASWQVAGALAVGVGGTGLLTVSNGALVQASGHTSVGNARSSVVLDGGRLRSGTVALGAPGQLDWRSGTLNVTGPAGAALDNVALPASLVLSPGRNLQVNETLAVRSASVLLLSGGTLSAGTLSLQDGLLASTQGGEHALQMDSIGSLVGTGQAQVRVAGGAGPAHRIQATGPLTLGLTARSDGFAFDGWLAVGGQQVTLLDRDWADLGHTTTLGNGGQLATINGARQGAGEQLRSNGAASVQGRFLNNGEVLVESGQLSFLSDVSGAGAYFGNVRFLAGFAPGNSTASVGFNGSEVVFGANSVLTLEVNSAAPGSGFDQLINIGRLSFAGVLHLDIGSGFAPAAGTRVQLLEFASFDGSLDRSRVVVTGYDLARVDLDRLALDGTVGFAALGEIPPPIPEPSTWALMLGGLGIMTWRAAARRRDRADR
jgi:T5SS/PEP-CTERM-associated repeat protein